MEEMLGKEVRIQINNDTRNVGISTGLRANSDSQNKKLAPSHKATPNH